MLKSPSSFCRGNKEDFDAFLKAAKIEVFEGIIPADASRFVTDSTVPKNYANIAERSSELYKKFKFGSALKNFTFDQDFGKLVDEDHDDIEANWPFLCLSYNEIKTSVSAAAGEAQIRRGVDLLLELVFEAPVDLPKDCIYRVERKLHLPKFNKAGLRSYPSDTSIADAVCYQPIPREVLDTITAYQHRKIAIGPDTVPNLYAPSAFEFKKDPKSNGRQAIMDAAAIQGVNRVLGLDIQNYSFGLNQSNMDIYFSEWSEDPRTKDYKYKVHIERNVFNLLVPAEFISFYSLLCRLRREHHLGKIRTALEGLKTKEGLFDRVREHNGWAAANTSLPSIQEPSGPNLGNEASGGGAENDMVDKDELADEDEIAFGEEASTKVPFTQFISGVLDDDDDDDKESLVDSTGEGTEDGDSESIDMKFVAKSVGDDDARAVVKAGASGDLWEAKNDMGYASPELTMAVCSWREVMNVS